MSADCYAPKSAVAVLSKWLDQFFTDYPMHELLNDPIDVAVDFTGHRVKPHHVRWGKKTYQMNTVNMVHRAREGTKNIFYFSVSDTANFMKLRLDPELLEWRLVEFYSD
jgi:ribosomal protein L24E